MAIAHNAPHYHLDKPSWRTTPEGDPRGYIQPHTLSELWFHTGTACNLSCPFCLEGSKPGDNRLQQITLGEAQPFIDAALDLGVEQFSFTGGEPFINKDIFDSLAHALERRPSLVLTNGTKPLRTRMDRVRALQAQPHPLYFRVSIDWPDPASHDAGRGEGNFRLAMETLGALHREGFRVSIARQMEQGEDAAAVNAAYGPHLDAVGVPRDIRFVAFPDFYPPGTHPPGVPHLTENCMTTYHTEATRAGFMCAYSKMVVKREGRMRVYACTLVDDDPDYDLGGDLSEAMRYRVMLGHHRCYSCFAYGASCSEK